MEVQVDFPAKNNATQMSDLTLDSVLNITIDINIDDDESTRMSGTYVSKNKKSTTTNTTGTTGSCTTTEISGYKLIAPPENVTSGWWKHFQIFHRKYTKKLHISKCRHCGKELSYNNGSTGLKTHDSTHKNNIEMIKVQLQSERNNKEIKFQKNLVLKIRIRNS